LGEGRLTDFYLFEISNRNAFY